MLGFLMALASQGMLWISDSERALPRWIAFYGCAMSLLLSSAIRILFPPVTGQILSANAPALWLKQAGGSGETLQGSIRVLKGMLAVVALAIVGAGIAERSEPPNAGIVVLLLVLVVAYRISKRA